MIKLYELIQNNEIEFFNKNKKIDANVLDVGQYGWNLVIHISTQSNNYLAVKGNDLESFLTEKDNISSLTNFLVQIWSQKPDRKFHVDADIERINSCYPQERELSLYNGLGQKTANLENWLKGKTVFERDWNLLLCEAIGRCLGYPGYELPRTEKEFEIVCIGHAEEFMIGTKKQLDRYKNYAQIAPASQQKIEENIKNFT